MKRSRAQVDDDTASIEARLVLVSKMLEQAVQELTDVMSSLRDVEPGKETQTDESDAD